MLTIHFSESRARWQSWDLANYGNAYKLVLRIGEFIGCCERFAVRNGPRVVNGVRISQQDIGTWLGQPTGIAWNTTHNQRGFYNVWKLAHGALAIYEHDGDRDENEDRLWQVLSRFFDERRLLPELHCIPNHPDHLWDRIAVNMGMAEVRDLVEYVRTRPKYKVVCLILFAALTTLTVALCHVVLSC